MFWFIILAILLISVSACGFYLSGMIIHPLTNSRENTLQMECDKGNMRRDYFEKLPKEEVRIRSQYGYELRGYFFPKADSRKTVIISHGITHTIYGSVKYMEMFIKRGFNVLIYDHRNHGESGGTNTTFGYYEKHDLKTCTDWLFEKYGNNSIVGLHGESMGASIALQNLAIDPRIAFCVADCSFSDLKELLKYRLKVEFKLPQFPTMQITGLFTVLRTGMSPGDISPLREISDVATPVFFVHGKDDLYIPAKMSIDMYNAKKGKRKLYLAPHARHTESIVMNKDEYDKLVGEFLEEIGF